MRWAWGAVLLAAVLPLTGCGGVGRRDYVHRNEAITRSLPVFPGAVAMHEFSTPEYGHGELSDPTGYTTTALYRVPPGTRGAAIVSFYERQLGRRGWQRGHRIGKAWLVEFTRGRGLVVVNTVTVRLDRSYTVTTDYRGASHGKAARAAASGTRPRPKPARRYTLARPAHSP